MAIFDKIFKITDESVVRKINASAVDTVASEEGITQLRKTLLDDGINIDGRIFTAGSVGVISRTASAKDEKGNERETPIEIPNAITRTENIECLDHDIILKPAYKKKSTHADFVESDADYFTYIVPYSPNLPDHPITNDDIIRTIRILMADDLHNHFYDLDADNFVFLKGSGGNLLSYPDSSNIPEDFRGKPIAFIRDLNAVPADFTMGKASDPELVDQRQAIVNEAKEKGLTRVSKWLQIRAGIDLKDLIPAPRECVDACKQQYFLTAQLTEQLKAAGIQNTLPAPPGITTIEGAKGKEIGSEASLER